MTSWLADVRARVRSLARSPAATLSNVGVLAFGGAGAAVLVALLSAAQLRPLPYRAPDALVWVGRGAAATPVERLTYPDAREWAARHDVLVDLAPYSSRTATLVIDGTPAMRASTCRVGGTFFAVLDVAAALGRVLGADDDRVGAAPVAVVSNALWRHRLGADPRAVGRSLTLDGVSYEIVGVMPETFGTPGAQTDVWTPLVPQFAPVLENRSVGYLDAIARLQAGVTAEGARDRLPPVVVAGAAAPFRPVVEGLRQHLFGDSSRVLLGLLCVVGTLICLTCSSCAGWFVARTIAGAGELAARAALGAPRHRLLSLVAIESALVWGAGVVGAGVLATAAWAQVPHFAAAFSLPAPRVADAALAWAVAATGALLACGVGAVLPAVVTLRVDPSSVLKTHDTHGSLGRAALRAQDLTAVASIACSVVLACLSVSVGRAVLELTGTDRGVRVAGVTTARLMRPGTVMTPALLAEVRRFAVAMIDSVAAGGAVAAVSVPMPLQGADLNTSLSSAAAPQHAVDADASLVTSAYFEVLRIPLVSGRSFTRDEERAGRAVCAIDRRAARWLFANRDPVGAWVHVAALGDSFRIVGVVESLRGREGRVTAPPHIYLSYAYLPHPDISLLVRSSSTLGATATALRRIARSIDADQPVAEVRSLDDVLADALGRPRFYLFVIGVFGSIALGVAVLGVAASVAHRAALDARSLAVRMALGATPMHVHLAVLRGAARIAVTGAGIGAAAAALTVDPILRALGVARDAGTTPYLAVLVALPAAALSASYWPAHRAARRSIVDTLKG